MCRKLNIRQVFLSNSSKIPIQWIPPEAFSDKSGKFVSFTKKTDIWAFGCSIYEVLARAYPWQNVFKEFLKSKNAPETPENYQIFLKHLKLNIYPEILKTGKPTVKDVFLKIWKANFKISCMDASN